MMRIDVRSDQVTIGGRVKGQVTWNADGGKEPRKIEVVWRRRFEGKKNDDSVVHSTSEDNTGSRSQIVVPFDFEVPADEPPTYRGKLISIVWEIVATADLPWAVDQHETKVINVTVPVWTAEQYRQSFDETDDDDDDVTEPSSETDPEER